MRPIFAIGLMLVVAFVHGQIPISQAVLDPRTGLIVHFPSDWSVDKGASPFTIVSFGGRKRPPQLLVPLNEAQIVVTSPPEGITSLPQWLHSDRVQAERGYQLRSLEVTTDHFGVVMATEARDQPSVIPEGTIVVYYLDLDHRPLKVAMVYRGDKRAKYFENVFLTVMKTLTPK